MAFIFSLRSLYLSWSQPTPLQILKDAPLAFQAWHTYDKPGTGWTRFHPTHHEADDNSRMIPVSSPTILKLATWNVDAFGKHPKARMDCIISQLQSLERRPDVVCFQEVSREAFRLLLNNEWIRDEGISSEADETN